MNIVRCLAALCAACIIFTAIPMAAQNRYFPSAAFGDPKGSQEWIALYSKYLEALKEPALLDRSQSGLSQSYRFLWLRSFHRPVSVRLEVRSDGAGIVTVKVGEKTGASSVGGSVQTITRTLTKREVDSFLDQIESNRFWKLPSEEEPVSGPDGARWIFEGVKGGEYHVVHRWAPKDGAVRILCLYLAVDLGRMKLADKEIY